MQSLTSSETHTLPPAHSCHSSLEPSWKYVLGDYELLEKLGEGSYGKVLKAKHRTTGKVYAIKHVKDVLYNTYEAHKLFREIHIMRKLSSMSKNIFTSKLVDVIVPFREVDSDTSKASEKSQLLIDELFMVQECFGADMSQMMREPENIALGEDHIKAIIYNILCGLHFIHSAQIVHRDIKPSNILINSECNVRICDFGLSRTLSGQKNSVSFTAAKKGDSESSTKYSTSDVYDESSSNELNSSEQAPLTARIGSRFYRAPEVVLCHKNYDFAIDIWSVGCILGELLLNFIEKPKSCSSNKTDSK